MLSRHSVAQHRDFAHIPHALRLEDRLDGLASTGGCLHRTWARNLTAFELPVLVEPRPDVMVHPQPGPILAAIGPFASTIVPPLMKNLEGARLAGWPRRRSRFDFPSSKRSNSLDRSASIAARRFSHLATNCWHCSNCTPTGALGCNFRFLQSILDGLRLGVSWSPNVCRAASNFRKHCCAMVATSSGDR